MQRPRVRFSLRTLLLFMLIACVALGWKVERARMQREAVAWVHEMGGELSFDYQIDIDGSNIQPVSSQWLRKQLGSHFFDDVVGVNLIEAKVSDVTPLSGLASLDTLSLSFTQVSNLTPLSRMTSLRYLSLSSTQVRDLTPLSGLTSLRRLVLWDTQVSDVTPLAGLTSLQELTLYDTQVSESSVDQLQKALPNCQIIR